MSTLLTLNTGNDGSLDYDSFLAEKVRFDRSYGFPVPPEAFSPIFQPGHPKFKPHQREIIGWAVEGGRRAIFARYGLGKSVMQLEILRLIIELAHVALADRLAARNALPGTFASLVPGSARRDVWTDVLRIDTLNSEQRRREVEAHICPFPLDIPRRLITMYSNPGELVGDPFSGLGSTVLEAVRQGRRGFGSELNPVSTADSVVYLTRHDNEANAPTLFDLIDIESEDAA